MIYTKNNKHRRSQTESQPNIDIRTISIYDIRTMGKCKTMFNCPRCNNECHVAAKKRGGYTCPACKQSMFLTDERIHNPEALRKSIEGFNTDNRPRYQMKIGGKIFNPDKEQRNNIISN